MHTYSHTYIQTFKFRHIHKHIHINIRAYIIHRYIHTFILRIYKYNKEIYTNVLVHKCIQYYKDECINIYVNTDTDTHIPAHIHTYCT